MKTFKHIHIGIFFATTIAAIYTPAIDMIKLIYHGKESLLALTNYAVFGIFSLLLIWIYLKKFAETTKSDKNSPVQKPRVHQFLTYLISFGFALLFAYIILKPVIFNFSPLIKVWAGICFSMVSSLVLNKTKSHLPQAFKPILSLLSFSLIVFILGIILNTNNYPLALSWSETIDYSYGHAFYAWIRGDQEVLLPFNNLGRYLLLAFPWFINDSDLIVHRLWENSLIIITPLLTSWLFIMNFKFSKPYSILFFLWGSLFLLQGPIYYNLLIIPIILFSVSNQKQKYIYLTIFLVSIWAGFSRVNWLPMPTAVWIIIYLYQSTNNSDITLKQNTKNIFKISILGLSGGALGYLLVSAVSNQSPLLVNAAFTALLLWYRLLPSSAYGIGILFWILIVTFPVLILIFYKNKNIAGKKPKYKYMIISLILLIFFLGGLLVSVKIGGGADIHNLDGFILLLFIIFIYEIWNRFTFSKSVFEKSKFYSAIFTLLFFIPSLAILNRTKSVSIPNIDVANRAILEIQEIIDFNKSNGKDVLLGDEQHLILFGKLSDITYNPLFDKNLILEAVMSQSIKYVIKNNLNPLVEHKYGALIMETQQWNIKEPKTDMFAEENNLYIRIFSKDFREYYQLDSTLNDGKLEIYLPILEVE